MTGPSREGSEQSVDRMLTVLTTEHYALQMIRGSTVFEASNRAGQYFATLSAVLIALGLAAQVVPTRVLLGLSCGLFSGVYVIGLITFSRAIESAIEDLRCGMGINRIRHYYQEAAPSAAPYFVMSPHDDVESVMSDGGRSIWPGYRRPARLGHFLSVAGLINLINGWIIGLVLGLAATLAGVGATPAAAGGIAGAVGSILWLDRFHRRASARGLSQIEIRFPAQASSAVAR
jgi:hypothetical protein